MTIDPEAAGRQFVHGLIPENLLEKEQVRPQSLAERMSSYKVPGVSVAIVEHGEIAGAYGYGVRDEESGEPVTSETLFQAASISKPVAAVGIMRLVDEGRLDLDADVNDYLQSWKVPPTRGWQPRISVRQLLSHTAGLGVSGFPGYPAGHGLPDTIAILDGVAPANTMPVRVDLLPGTRFRYSGGGYTVLELLIEDVTGDPFASYMQRAVLDPLGMARSQFSHPLPEQHWSQAASGHRSGGGVMHGRWNAYPELAAAGLWTTAPDLARFGIAMQEMLDGKRADLFSSDAIQQMLTPQLEAHIGLGFFLDGSQASRRFGHTGGNAGFRCELVMYREGGRGAAVMSNGDNGLPLIREILRAIASEFDWPDYGEEEEPAPASEPESFVGQYDTDHGLRFIVAFDQGQLYLIAPGQGQLPIGAAGDDEFVSAALDVRVSFETAEDGTSMTLRIKQDGVTLVATKAA